MLTVPNAKDSDKATLVQVRIYDGNEWHEFANYGQYERVFGVELSANIDNPVWSCDRLEFRNRRDLGPSLDPDDPDSDFNDGTIANTLLSPKHPIEIILSKDDFNTQVVKFRGAVGPITGRRTVDKDDVITVSPLDQAQPLKEPIIEGIDPTNQQPYVYNDIWIEDLIDEIVQLKGHQISLDRANSDIPDFLVNEIKLKGITPWKAASNVAEKVGHKLIFRTPSISEGKQLLLFDPQRGVVGRRLEQDDPEWTPDETIKGGYDVRETEKEQKGVRTACRVHYVDENLGQHSVFVEDEQALEDYGARDYSLSGKGQIHRTMVLKEDDKSQISTEIEAANYGYYALGDHNAPTTSVDYGLRYCHPGLQLYDIVRWEGVPDYDVEMAVNSISLSIGYERQEGDTQVSGTVKRVRGSRKYWMEMGHLPDTIDEYRGDQKPPPAPEDPPGLTKNNYIDDTKSEKAKVICEGAHNPAKDVVGYRWRFREIIDGEKEEWQISSDTGEPATVLRGLDVGKNIELEVQYQAKDFETSYPSGVDGDGEWSPSGFVSLYPDTTPPDAPTLDEANGNPGNIELLWSAPTTNKDGSELKDLDGYIVYLRKDADPTKDTYDVKREETADKFTYNSVSSGETYHCAVVAVDQVGNKSDLSNILTAQVKSTGYNDDPSTFNDSFADVQVGDGMIGFQFNTPQGWQGFDHWELQQSKDGGSYTTIWEGRGVGHVDKGLDRNSSYEYKLLAVGIDGNKSSGSTTGPWTPDRSDNSNITGNVFMADIIVAPREVRTQHIEVGSLSAIQALTGNIKTGSSGARFEIFPDSDTGIELIDDNGNTVLEGIIGGTNIGDVIIGSLAGDHVQWDKSAGNLNVKGGMTVTSGSGIGNFTDAGVMAEKDAAKVSDSTLYIDGNLTVTGQLLMAGGDVTLGDGALDSGYDGLHVEDGNGNTRVEAGELSNGTYGLWAKDSTGKVVWGSQGEFRAAPAFDVGGSSTVWDSGSPGTSIHYKDLGDLTGMEHGRQYLVVIKCQYEWSNFHARLVFGPGYLSSFDSRSSDYDLHRGIQSTRIGSNHQISNIICFTDDDSTIAWKSYDDNVLSLWLEAAIPLTLD